jgi:hypothetical protein
MGTQACGTIDNGADYFMVSNVRVGTNYRFAVEGATASLAVWASADGNRWWNLSLSGANERVATTGSNTGRVDYILAVTGSGSYKVITESR